mgnify:FL=1
MSKVRNVVTSSAFFAGIPALVAWAFIVGYRSESLTTNLLWILVWIWGAVIWMRWTRPIGRWLLRRQWQRWIAIVGPICGGPILIFWYTGGPLETVIWACWFSLGFGIGLAWSLVEDYPGWFEKYPIGGSEHA